MTESRSYEWLTSNAIREIIEKDLYPAGFSSTMLFREGYKGNKRASVFKRWLKSGLLKEVVTTLANGEALDES